VAGRLVPTVVLLGASVLWGLTWLPLKHFGSVGIEGPLVTLSAHGSVGVLALPFLAASRRTWLGEWPSLALLAAFGGLANLAFATAMMNGDVTRVMALFYLLPAWGVVLARVLLHEPIDTKRVLSLGSALAGAFLVLGGPRILVAPPSFIDALALLSGFALAVNNVVFRKTQRLAVATKVAAVFVGSLGWGAFTVALGGGNRPVTAGAGEWLAVVAFGLVWILLATAGTLFGVNHLEAGRSSVLILMELVTATVSSSLLSRRIPDAAACVGGALILISALIEALRRDPAGEPESPPTSRAPVSR
jgi:drug/metabolite transporter (DMT)-like permease